MEMYGLHWITIWIVLQWSRVPLNAAVYELSIVGCMYSLESYVHLDQTGKFLKSFQWLACSPGVKSQCNLNTRAAYGTSPANLSKPRHYALSVPTCHRRCLRPDSHRRRHRMHLRVLKTCTRERSNVKRDRQPDIAWLVVAHEDLFPAIKEHMADRPRASRQLL